jgi:hypothetical protein
MVLQVAPSDIGGLVVLLEWTPERELPLPDILRFLLTSFLDSLLCDWSPARFILLDILQTWLKSA